MKIYVNIWRSIENIMDHKFIAKVFLHNINPINGTCNLHYIRGPFMDMVHMLIANQRYMLRFDKIKYTSSTKDNHKKSYQRKGNNQINMAEPSTRVECKEFFYKLHIASTKILKDYFAKGLIGCKKGKNMV